MSRPRGVSPLSYVFSHLRIAFKVLVAPLITTTLMISIWIVSSSGLQDQAKTIDGVVNESFRSALAANNLFQQAATVQSDIFRLLVWQSMGRQEQILEDVHSTNQKNIDKLDNRLQQLLDTVPNPEAELVSRLAALTQRFQLSAQSANSVAMGDPAQGSGMVVNTATTYDEFRQVMERFQQLAERRADRRAAQAARDAQELSRLLGFVVLGDMIVAITVTLLVSRHISQGVSRITRTTTRLAQGELDVTIADQYRRDEIGSMARALRVLQQSERERRRLEEERVEAEKMASLGGLVAGVAHEINTPIGVCLTATTHLREKTNQLQRRFDEGQIKRSDLREYMTLAQDTTNLMMDNIHRASDLIKSFKKVAVDQTSEEKRNFDLAQYVEEVLHSLTPQLRKLPHHVTSDLPADVTLNSYPGPFGQVITNLILNAATHAFSETEEGTITVAAQPLSDGQHILLTVADDGAGMSEDVRTQIFEPFFTTRRGEGGSGLGLHLVYNIVVNSLGGRIVCHSTPGTGTRFEITLPYDPDTGQQDAAA